MKKVFAIILSALMLCNMFTVTFADDTVDTTAATKFAEKINTLFPDSCTVSENTVVLKTTLNDLPETLKVEAGGEVILDLRRSSIRAAEGIDAIEVCKGAKLTIMGSGSIYGGDGAEIYKHEDGRVGILNKGTLIIEDANVYGGESVYNKNGVANEKLYAMGGTAIRNEGYTKILDGRITGGDFNRSNGTGIGGMGIDNSGELVAEGGNISGGDGARSDDGTEFWAYGGTGIKNSGDIDLSNATIRGGNGATYGGCAIENMSDAEYFYAEGCFMSVGRSNYYGTLDENYIETAFLNNADAEIFDCNADSIYNNGELVIDGESYAGYIENVYRAKVTIESATVSSAGERPAIVNDGEMVINDGQIDGGYAQTQGADGMCGILNKRTLTVNGGNIKGGHPFDNSGKGGCGINNLPASSVIINGGEIAGGDYCENPGVGILAEGNVTINEGLIAGGLASDYEAFAKPISGSYTVGYNSVVQASIDNYEYFELIGSTGYRYLKFEAMTSAIALAKKINSYQPGACYYDEDTVYLTEDVTVSGRIDILPGEPCALNLSGYTLKAKGNGTGFVIGVQENAEVTICNGGIEGESINETEGTGGAVAGIHNYGKLNLESCTVKGSSSLGFDEYGGCGIYNYTTGVLEVTDCYIYGGVGEEVGEVALSNLGTAKINSGKFVGGASENGVVPAISGNISVSQGAYLQESDDDISYSRVTGTNTKQYLQVIEESAATKLAEIIEGYSPNSCVIKKDNVVEITKPVTIDSVIAIPAGDEVVLRINNLSCNGLYVPEGAYLTLTGDGELTGTGDAVVNDGTLDIRGGTYKGGPSGRGILNNGSLTVYDGTVIGGDEAEAINSSGKKLCLYEGEFIGGVAGEKRVSAIIGKITAGECITKSTDGESYTMITAPEITAPYVVARGGTPTERAALSINLKYPNSCRYLLSEDFEQEKIMMVADCDLLELEGDGIVASLNEHTFGGIITDGNIEITGVGHITDFLMNNRELTISDRAEINGVIINCGNLVTTGEINGGILNREKGRVYVEGGTITGSAKNFDTAIYHEDISSVTVINKGIVKGSDCGVNLMLREGGSILFQVNGGAVIGENGPAVKARIIKPGSGGGGGISGGGASSGGGSLGGGISGGGASSGGGSIGGDSSSAVETYYLNMNGGILEGGEGYPALSGCIEAGEDVVLKISEDGINYTVLEDNKTDARFVKAVGPQKYWQIGTSNRRYDGTTLSFDLEVDTNDQLKGSIYVGIYEGTSFVRCEIFEVKSDRISIACTENQTVKVFWWDENMCPVIEDLGVPKS